MNIKTLFNVQSLLWLALVLALAGSLNHLAAVFASVDNDSVMGWVQAVAIDAGLFALAYSMQNRKAQGRPVRFTVLGIALFVGISVYGNLAYGMLATTGTLPEWVLVTRPYVLAGALPVLVLYLSELLADDKAHRERESNLRATLADLEGQVQSLANDRDKVAADLDKLTLNRDTLQQGIAALKSQKSDTIPSNVQLKPDTLKDKGDVARQDIQAARRDKLAELWQEGITVKAELARQLGVTPKTINRDIEALGLNGTGHREVTG